MKTGRQGVFKAHQQLEGTINAHKAPSSAFQPSSNFRP